MSPLDRRVTIPHDISDAVELWARQQGRHGTIGWNAALNCAVIDLTLKADDPRMKAYQEGKLRHEPKESIPLHYQPRPGSRYEPIDLHQLGVSGLVSMLEEANVMSGRGKYASMMEAVQAVERHNENLREQMRAAIRQNSRDRAMDMRRQILDLPLVSVPDNIGASNG